MILTQLYPNDFEPPDGMEVKWPGDDRVWHYSRVEKKCIPGPRADDGFAGGDVWEKESDDNWEDPNPGRSLPWVL